MSQASVQPLHSGDQPAGPEVLAKIARALSGLRYGAVEIIVHGGSVTQIERRERVRLHADSAGRPVDQR